VYAAKGEDKMKNPYARRDASVGGMMKTPLRQRRTSGCVSAQPYPLSNFAAAQITKPLAEREFQVVMQYVRGICGSGGKYLKGTSNNQVSAGPRTFNRKYAGNIWMKKPVMQRDS
jgi:hypothetical protein